jgi:multidrug resistance protein, MATE family
MTLLYVVFPGVFIEPFAARSRPETFGPIRDLTIVLLRFVAVYSIFDTMNIVFASALRGAGDTRYVMIMLGVISLIVLVAPTCLVLVVLKGGIYAAWTIAAAYVIILGFSFLIRFLGGKWKSMRVIEEVKPFVPAVLPDSPMIDAD